MSDNDKIITVDFKSAIESDDLFQHLNSVHPASTSFENYFSKYTNHPHFVNDLKRRMNKLTIETVDVVCYVIEQTRLGSFTEKVSALAYQRDGWMRYRIYLTLRLLNLSFEVIEPLGWFASDEKPRIGFCLEMFDQANAHPYGFAEQWNALRKASHQAQLQIVNFLGRAPDDRAIPFLKAFAQAENMTLTSEAVMELGRRGARDVCDFIENLWMHHHTDQAWQGPLLIALRRQYLLPDKLV